jgi:hypothetical protein
MAGRSLTRVMSLAPTVTAAARAHEIDPLLLHAIAPVKRRLPARAALALRGRSRRDDDPAAAVVPDRPRRFN